MQLFDPSPDYVAEPGQPGFPRWTLDVVSAELPCGAAWLATALLALGIPLFKPWGIRDHGWWRHLGGRRFEFTFPGDGWTRLVPDLEAGRVFDFRPLPVPRFTHAEPGRLVASGPAILCVRDPRDALASAAARARRTRQVDASVDDAAFAALPRWPGGPSSADYLHDHTMRWIDAVAARPHLLLRFEDVKADPGAELRRVFGLLDLPLGADECERACRAATHERVAQNDRRLVDSGAVPTPILGPGRPHAWREAPDPALEAVMGPRYDDLCTRLGYEPLRHR